MLKLKLRKLHQTLILEKASRWKGWTERFCVWSFVLWFRPVRGTVQYFDYFRRQRCELLSKSRRKIQSSTRQQLRNNSVSKCYIIIAERREHAGHTLSEKCCEVIGLCLWWGLRDGDLQPSPASWSLSSSSFCSQMSQQQPLRGKVPPAPVSTGMVAIGQFVEMMNISCTYVSDEDVIQ